GLVGTDGRGWSRPHHEVARQRAVIGLDDAYGGVGADHILRAGVEPYHDLALLEPSGQSLEQRVRPALDLPPPEAALDQVGHGDERRCRPRVLTGEPVTGQGEGTQPLVAEGRAHRAAQTATRSQCGALLAGERVLPDEGHVE